MMDYVNYLAHVFVGHGCLFGQRLKVSRLDRDALLLQLSGYLRAFQGSS